jgi:hypothetical protein
VPDDGIPAYRSPAVYGWTKSYLESLRVKLYDRCDVFDFVSGCFDFLFPRVAVDSYTAKRSRRRSASAKLPQYLDKHVARLKFEERSKGNKHTKNRFEASRPKMYCVRSRLLAPPQGPKGREFQPTTEIGACEPNTLRT